jgi:hypothetical protein
VTLELLPPGLSGSNLPLFQALVRLMDVGESISVCNDLINDLGEYIKPIPLCSSMGLIRLPILIGDINTTHLVVIVVDEY